MQAGQAVDYPKQMSGLLWFMILKESQLLSWQKARESHEAARVQVGDVTGAGWQQWQNGDVSGSPPLNYERRAAHLCTT